MAYAVRTVHVNKYHPLFDYCHTLTALTNNLYNAALFRQRQVMTAVKKDESLWSSHEKDVMDELRNALPLMNRKNRMPDVKHFLLNRFFLDDLMRHTWNPDYFAPGLPRQTAQQTLASVCRSMKSFFSSIREWKKNPSAFTGKPELPGYRHKRGHSAACITNQDAVIKYIGGRMFIKLPLTNIRVDIGPSSDIGKLKEVQIVPGNGEYTLTVITEKDFDVSLISDTPERISSIDAGVDNLMAVANNCSLPCILYKGGIVKSINQWYNKSLSSVMSKQTMSSGKRFRPSDESNALTIRRNNQMNDLLHKVSKHFIAWCVENRIDTVVFGANRYWKQNISIGHTNNQNFVQIPFFKLKNILKYLCERHGIRFIEQEESYTSRASFPDRDFIPVYGKEPEEYSFSGRRRPVRYKGVYKPDGFRGLYTTKNGTVINSDLNGSANILRKAFPDAFDEKQELDFANVMIVRHPDAMKIQALKERQTEKNRQRKLCAA